MNNLSDIEKQLEYCINFISDTEHDSNREDWKNEYARVHPLMRLDNINRLSYELLEKYKNDELRVTWTSYNRLFCNARQFSQYLKEKGTPLNDAYGLGELFVYMSSNINMTSKENEEISDIDFNETLYLKAKELGDIPSPWFLYQEPQNLNATLEAVTKALNHVKVLEMIHNSKVTDLPTYSDVAQIALQVLTKATAYKPVNSYPYVCAYIELVNLSYFSRRLNEVSIESIIHELDLMQRRLQEHLNVTPKELVLHSLPTSVSDKPSDKVEPSKSVGISLDFFKKD